MAHSLKVLAYHKVQNTDLFEQQMEYLKNHYNILGLEVLSNLDIYKNFERPLLITFDDGDKSFYSNAFPVLRKKKIPALVFLITDLIESKKAFWWDEIEYYLGKEEGNKMVWEVKTWPNKKREEYLRQLRENSSKPNLNYEQLTIRELKEMQREKIVIGNHSHTHPMFNQSTEEELKWELNKSTSKLQELGFHPEVFAYPNGNYSITAERKLKEEGIELAFLFDHKINKGKINPLRISRLIVNDSTPLWKFKLILNGWHSHILPFTKTLGKIRKNLSLK